MRVWLASYPRSGNTFFRIILGYQYGLPSADRKAMPPRWEKLWQVDAAHQPSPDPAAPQFVKTHTLPGGDTDPAVYIVRDGRDSLVSHTHFALTCKGGMAPESVTPGLFRETLRDLILQKHPTRGTWASNVDAWTARPNTAVVRYEDLVADPSGVTRRALDSLGLRLAPVADAIPSFEELQAVDPKFFRRGVRGAHRDEFPADLLDLFWEHNGAAMTRVGYARDADRHAA
jgi:hypothetical protein